MAVSVFPLWGMLGQRAHHSRFPGRRQVLLPASSLPLRLWYLGNYHPAPQPPGPITAVTGGETLGVPQSGRHPNPISLDGESELFLRVSCAGPAPTVPTAQYHDIGTCLPQVGQCKAQREQVPFAAQSGTPDGHVPVSAGDVRARDFLMVLRSFTGVWGQGLGFFNTGAAGAAVLTLFFIIMILNYPGFLPELIREEELWIICNI